jgi:hypothetical protein
MPTIGYLIKLGMDAWSGSNKNSDIFAISSIVQYTLMIIYLAIVLVVIGGMLHTGTIITNNFMWFFGSLMFIFIVYVAILVLYAAYYSKLQYGRIAPSITDTINKLIMIPLWIIIFYNMHTFLDCKKSNTCSSPISFTTFAVLAFGLLQLYLVYTSFKVMRSWPTDDILF